MKNTSDQFKVEIDLKRKKKLMNALYNNQKLKIKCRKLDLQFVSYKCVKLQFDCRNICSKTIGTGDNATVEMAEYHVKSTSSIHIHGHVDNSDNDNCNVNNMFDDANNGKWTKWSKSTVSAWVEYKLRKYAADAQKQTRMESDLDNNVDSKEMDTDDHDDNDDIDDELDANIDNFMNKFDGHDIDGAVLVELKENKEYMTQCNNIMSNYSLGLWRVVKNEINLLVIPQTRLIDSSMNNPDEDNDSGDRDVEPLLVTPNSNSNQDRIP